MSRPRSGKVRSPNENIIWVRVTHAAFVIWEAEFDGHIRCHFWTKDRSRPGKIRPDFKICYLPSKYTYFVQFHLRLKRTFVWGTTFENDKNCISRGCHQFYLFSVTAHKKILFRYCVRFLLVYSFVLFVQFFFMKSESWILQGYYKQHKL